MTIIRPRQRLLNATPAYSMAAGQKRTEPSNTSSDVVFRVTANPGLRLKPGVIRFSATVGAADTIRTKLVAQYESGASDVLRGTVTITSTGIEVWDRAAFLATAEPVGRIVELRLYAWHDSLAAASSISDHRGDIEEAV